MLKLTSALQLEIARYNAGVVRARRAYAARDDEARRVCIEGTCTDEFTCYACRAAARKLLVAATNVEECAELLAIMDRPSPPRSLAACGTEAAYRRHLRRGEEACRPCLDAHSPPVQRERAPCGTNAGYLAHHRANEDACRPCLDAHNAYQRQIGKARP